MSMKSLIRLNREVSVPGKPKGWVVRELLNPTTNKSVVFELGMYLSKNVFIGVPLHYIFRDKLILDHAKYNDDYTYYKVPSDLEFALSTFRSKKDKEFPVLIQPDDEHPAMAISCITCTPESGHKILNATLDEGSITIRDYIDKERNSISIIAGVTDTNIINPTLIFKVTTGVIGSKSKDVITITASSGTVNIKTDGETTKEPVKTDFISLNRFIKKRFEKKSKNDKKVEKNDSVETEN